MGGRGVQLGQQEPGLGSVLVTDNITGNGESLSQQFLRTDHWCLKELLEVFVSSLVLVSGLSPGGNGLSVEDQNVEEGVQEQDRVGFDRDTVQQDGLGLALEAVRHERGLDHDQRVVDVFTVQNVTVVGSLVRRVVEDLQELGTTEMEHELGVDREVLCEAERLRLVLAVVGKLLAETNQHSVQPAQNIRTIIYLGLENGNTGHQNSGSLLVERLTDNGTVTLSPAN